VAERRQHLESQPSQTWERHLDGIANKSDAGCGGIQMGRTTDRRQRSSPACRRMTSALPAASRRVTGVRATADQAQLRADQFTHGKGRCLEQGRTTTGPMKEREKQLLHTNSATVEALSQRTSPLKQSAPLSNTVKSYRSGVTACHRRFTKGEGPPCFSDRPALQRSVDQPEPQRFQHRLVLVDRPQFAHRVLDMEHGCALAYAQDAADLPGRLAFHRPAERFEFAWGQ
jgi:hypothetical protein